MAGALAEALARVARTPVTLTCAGRTDAGVHALDQVVHFDLPGRPVGRPRPRRPGRVVQQPAGPGHRGPGGRGRRPDGFDARHSATARRYRYLVVNAPVADPLLAGLAWHVADPLDLRSMAAAADALLGRARLPGLLPPGARAPRPTTRSPAG